MEEDGHHLSRVSSENDLTMKEEEEMGLLPSKSKLNSALKSTKKRAGFTGLYYLVAIALLLSSNIILSICLLFSMRHRSDSQVEAQPSWLPPEIYHDRILEYQGIYAGEPTVESDEAWTQLIPSSFPLGVLFLFHN
jgi:hypothetical protein